MGEVGQRLAMLAELLGQDRARRLLQLTDRGEPEIAELFRHHPADTPEVLDRQHAEEARLVAGRHHDEPVGLLELGGDLGHELVRGEPGRRGQLGLGADPLLDQPNRVERGAEERLGSGQVDERFVDRHGLHQR